MLHPRASRTAVPVPKAQRRNDHPGQVLHVRQDSGEQVGSLPRPSAGGVHRRRCPGCPWLEEILLPQNAPRPCGSD
uniref:Uncharacterized protein n=1 Tax=Junco hyemalis TaxID=40217 RepID=A0A8C5JBB6_JUNHY